MLTPADERAGLSSTDVSLNGIMLELAADGKGGMKLPAMQPKKETGSVIELQPLTFGFFVLPDANAPACLA
jgi:hypothetical protein